MELFYYLTNMVKKGIILYFESLVNRPATCNSDVENLSLRLQIEVSPPSGPVNAAKTSGSSEETS